MKTQVGYTFYTKLVAAMFGLLQETAAQNSKYTDIVLMENNHFFFRFVMLFLFGLISYDPKLRDFIPCAQKHAHPHMTLTAAHIHAFSRFCAHKHLRTPIHFVYLQSCPRTSIHIRSLCTHPRIFMHIHTYAPTHTSTPPPTSSTSMHSLPITSR